MKILSVKILLYQKGSLSRFFSCYSITFKGCVTVAQTHSQLTELTAGVLLNLSFNGSLK